MGNNNSAGLPTSIFCCRGRREDALWGGDGDYGEDQLEGGLRFEYGGDVTDLSDLEFDFEKGLGRQPALKDGRRFNTTRLQSAADAASHELRQPATQFREKDFFLDASDRSLLSQKMGMAAQNPPRKPSDRAQPEKKQVRFALATQSESAETSRTERDNTTPEQHNESRGREMTHRAREGEYEHGKAPALKAAKAGSNIDHSSA